MSSLYSFFVNIFIYIQQQKYSSLHFCSSYIIESSLSAFHSIPFRWRKEERKEFFVILKADLAFYCCIESLLLDNHFYQFYESSRKIVYFYSFTVFFLQPPTFLYLLVCSLWWEKSENIAFDFRMLKITSLSPTTQSQSVQKENNIKWDFWVVFYSLSLSLSSRKDYDFSSFFIDDIHSRFKKIHKKRNIRKQLEKSKQYVGWYAPHIFMIIK